MDKEDVHILVSYWSRQGQLEKIAALWNNGYNFDWQALFGKNVFSKVPLPVYKFEKIECKMPRKKVVDEGYKTLHDRSHKEAHFHTINVSNLYKIQYRINVLMGVDGLGRASHKEEEFECELAKELRDIANQAMDCDTELKASPRIDDIFMDNAGFVVDVFPLTADDGGFLSSVMLSITSKAGHVYKWTYVPKRVGYLDTVNRDMCLVGNGNNNLGGAEHDFAHLSEQYVQKNIGNGIRCGTREHLEKPSLIQLANISNLQKKTNQMCQEELADNAGEHATEYQGNISSDLPINVLKKFLEQLLHVNTSHINHRTRLSDLNIEEGELGYLTRELALRFSVSTSGEELCLHSTVDDLLQYISGELSPAGKSHNSKCIKETSLDDITEFLIGKLAEVLYTDVAHIDSAAPFVDLGLDSILGVEWIDMLNREYSLGMAATIVYEYPNIEALANHTQQLLVGKTIQTASVSRNSSSGMYD